MGDLIISVLVRSAGLLVFLAALALTGRTVRECLGAKIEERTERRRNSGRAPPRRFVKTAGE